MDALYIAGEAANAWQDANHGKVAGLTEGVQGYEVYGDVTDGDAPFLFAALNLPSGKVQVTLPSTRKGEGITEVVSEAFAITVARMVR